MISRPHDVYDCAEFSGISDIDNARSRSFIVAFVRREIRRVVDEIVYVEQLEPAEMTDISAIGLRNTQS